MAKALSSAKAMSAAFLFFANNVPSKSTEAVARENFASINAFSAANLSSANCLSLASASAFAFSSSAFDFSFAAICCSSAKSSYLLLMSISARRYVSRIRFSPSFEPVNNSSSFIFFCSKAYNSFACAL